MAATKAPAAVLGLAALQILLAIIIIVVTYTELNPGGGNCYLNLLKGSVCDFVYVTSGFGIFFSFLLLLPAAGTLRGGQASFLQPIFASLSVFAGFWWMVLAITITKRGAQATGAGYDGTASRNTVVGLSWIEFALFFFTFLAVVYDRVQYRAYRTRLDRSRSVLDLEEQTQFKTKYASTQVGSVAVA